MTVQGKVLHAMRIHVLLGKGFIDIDLLPEQLRTI